MSHPMPMSAIDIAAVLPQRYPIAMLDRVLEINDEGTYCKAYKNFSVNEPFFVGHFPNRPVVPGVLLLESMAQACSVMLTLGLTEQQRADGKTFFFAGVDKARFKKVVLPGDRFDIECHCIRSKMGVFQCEVSGFVDGQLACNAILTTVRQ